MSLFRLDASIRGDLSVSHALADTAEAAWRQAHPTGTVVRRDLFASPVPADTWQLAVSARGVEESERTEDQRRAVAHAAALADEFIAADAYVLGLPFYNWGVSQHVKVWLDVLLTDPRLTVGAEQILAGRPAQLILTRGGGYGPEAPKFGWDHATPYYRHLFGDHFGLDLHVNEVEFTLAEAVPAMEPLRGMAREQLDAGHQSAGSHGEQMARRVLARAAA